MSLTNEQCEWISVSELADRIGKTPQTCYNMIKQGLYETKEYKRGTMRGLLVKYPICNDN